MRWSGKLIDANGRIGTIELDIDDEKGGEGAWKILLAERNTSCELTGKAQLVATENGVELRSTSTEKGGESNWTARLVKHKAGRYAESAMLGQYEAVAGANAVMSVGVIALWHFK